LKGRPRRCLALLAFAMLGVACGSVGHAPPAPAVAPETEGRPAAQASAQPAPPATAVPYSNTIRWSTASEDDNFGFDVYRAESEDGPFVRLTETPIEGGGNTDEPRFYSFVDDTIDPSRTYYYYVESISMSGARERFTPVGKAAPKLPAAPP
jgi:fibronectin type 3 domain-containing protein